MYCWVACRAFSRACGLESTFPGDERNIRTRSTCGAIGYDERRSRDAIGGRRDRLLSTPAGGAAYDFTGTPNYTRLRYVDRRPSGV